MIPIALGCLMYFGPITESECEQRWGKCQKYIRDIEKQICEINSHLDEICGKREMVWNPNGFGWVDSDIRHMNGTCQFLWQHEIDVRREAIKVTKDYEDFWFAMWYVAWEQKNDDPVSRASWQRKARETLGIWAFQNPRLVPPLK